MNTKVLIQARVGSTRCPGKVLKPLVNDVVLIEFVIKRILMSKYINKEDIVILTTEEDQDLPLYDFAKTNGYICYRGSENDVHSRYYDFLKMNPCVSFFRVCADNPFIDAYFLDKLIELSKNSLDWDYISYAEGDTPAILTHYGLFAELVFYDSFLKSRETINSINDNYYFEHVTPIFYKTDKYTCRYIEIPDVLKKLDGFRTTIDTYEDLENIKYILEGLNSDSFIYTDLINFISKNNLILEQMKLQKDNNRK